MTAAASKPRRRSRRCLDNTGRGLTQPPHQALEHQCVAESFFRAQGRNSTAGRLGQTWDDADGSARLGGTPPQNGRGCTRRWWDPLSLAAYEQAALRDMAAGGGLTTLSALSTWAQSLHAESCARPFTNLTGRCAAGGAVAGLAGQVLPSGPVSRCDWRSLAPDRSASEIASPSGNGSRILARVPYTTSRRWPNSRKAPSRLCPRQTAASKGHTTSPRRHPCPTKASMGIGIDTASDATLGAMRSPGSSVSLCAERRSISAGGSQPPGP